MPPSQSGSNSLVDGNADPDAVSSRGKTRGEPNDTFDTALAAVFNRQYTANLQGTLHRPTDVDVFDLGPLDAGDRIIVDLDAGDRFLDAAVGIFDADFNIFMDNDDREGGDRPLDPRVDQTIRHASDRYYLVVAASPFAGGPAYSVGPYRIAVEVRPGGQVPPAEPQVLLLDFDGGEVNAEGIPVSDVQPFDAADIHSIYADDTQTIRESIIQTVRDNFEGFAVEIYTSDDPPPADRMYSTVFFGGRNPIAFGIAEDVDHYNSVKDDVVVIFTSSFHPRAFSLAPGPRELGVAIGNIASHETGHILGLNHVDDFTDLMDAVSHPDTFLTDQEFKTSPRSDQIMPLGYQDALLLLAEIIGLT